MASVVFLRDTTANIANIPIVDGQVIFSTNENFIYIDNGNQRTQYRNNGTAAGVQYDNSGSTLISTTVNGAINELDGKTQVATTSRLGIVKPDGTTTSTDANGVISVINNSASNTTYNNQSSGLTADDVQEAIDELKTLIATLQSNVYTKTEVDNALALKFDKSAITVDGNTMNVTIEEPEE
jgi:hypothetical protein